MSFQTPTFDGLLMVWNMLYYLDQARYITVFLWLNHTWFIQKHIPTWPKDNIHKWVSKLLLLIACWRVSRVSWRRISLRGIILCWVTIWLWICRLSICRLGRIGRSISNRWWDTLVNARHLLHTRCLHHPVSWSKLSITLVQFNFVLCLHACTNRAVNTIWQTI